MPLSRILAPFAGLFPFRATSRQSGREAAFRIAYSVLLGFSMPGLRIALLRLAQP